MKDCIEQLEASGDYRVIARLQPRDTYHEEAAVEKKIGIYLDTETTGFDPATDKVIELAMVPFEYDDAGRIYRVLPAYNGLADPGFPIPPVVTKVTGEGVKLEYLAYKFGFFYDGHRATVDCQAGIELLSRQLPGSGEFVLKRLLDTASINLVRLWAKGAPFDKKDSLKQRGYRWNTGDDGQPKAWYTDIPQATLDAEMAYLNEHIYPRAIWILPTRVLDANIRYSKRI
ncbi:MAG: exonuclease domain-containing protein [Gammaproteobacteria bacterium]